MELLPFQRRFLQKALKPDVEIAALCGPRGLGKSFISGIILSRCLTPGDPLFEAGVENGLVSGSLEQARVVFRYVRERLEPLGGYRFMDSTTRLGVVHVKTNTRLKVFSSNPKTSLGIVGMRVLVVDEPAALDVIGGTALYDSLVTALGKAGSPLKLIFSGTLAPAAPGSWWPQLVERGSHGSTYVELIQGRAEKWESTRELARCNPLVQVSEPFKKRLLVELAEAKEDSRLKARYLSFRLNLPSVDSSQVLLTVDDWAGILCREVPARSGRPIVGIDLGAGRAFSAAAAWYSSGRVECLAVAPGVPSIDIQERRDRVPAGTYTRLQAEGTLTVATGLQVQPISLVWETVLNTWGRPRLVIADRFKFKELADVLGPRVPLESRIPRWSESWADISALRRMAKDGPMAVDHGSRGLLAASLAAAMVENEDGGGVRLVKKGTNNQGRDDVAAALVLSAGAHSRLEKKHRSVYLGTV